MEITANKSVAVQAYHTGLGVVLDRIGSVLGGKRYNDDSGEDKTYNANRPPADKPYDINNNDNNSNNKPNDTKENNTNNNT